MYLSSSAMDIKELKFLDFQNSVNKPSSDQGAATEPRSLSVGRRGQSDRSALPQVTSSSSHACSGPVTILRRGRNIPQLHS